MGKKVKFKVKRGKVKVKLKSKNDTLPLSATDLRGLLALGMASALESGRAPEPKELAIGSGRTPMLTAGDLGQDESVGDD